ncbi:helix-turn-helix domain-containing protein [Streptobacillus moniliformis]|uniref:helix-turn-helix domain-containing protein n=1 Tax=Streptobacillus moniliformis TaxID=34105 RepID=UPI0007E30B44|nr:transcriptional regulator [Streptobacillus moniliformis]
MDNKNQKFKDFLDNKGIKHKKVAELLKISPSRFSLKLNEKKGAELKWDEIGVICSFFEISADEYFF